MQGDVPHPLERRRAAGGATSGADLEARQVIDDHDRHPRRYGLRDPFDVEARVVNPTCGDRVTLRLALEGGWVTDVSYEVLGCSLGRASASVMSDLVVGRHVSEALATARRFTGLLRERARPDPAAGACSIVALDDEEVLGEALAFAGVGRYPSRMRCVLLGWTALCDAVSAVEGASSCLIRPR